MRIRVLAVVFFVTLTVASVRSNSNQIPAVPTSVLAKIDPWVLEETAAKGQAEFLVLLADQADLSGADRLSTKEEKGRYVYRTLYDTAQATQKSLLIWLKAHSVEHRSFYIVNMIWVKGNLDVALTLASRSDVRRVDGNPLIHNKLPEPSPFPDTDMIGAPEAIEPGISYTNAPQVWAMGYSGQGIVVGAQDTGYRWDHDALKSHYRGFDGSTANHNYNWHDSIHSGGGSCGPNSTIPCDDHGHGTHTAGTAIGDDGLGNQIGMAPGAKWIGCRNMDLGNGTPATYIECFEFFLAPYPVGGTPAQGDPTKAPDVTTNSWGCPPSEGCNTASLQAAVAAQRAAGIVTVVAAGNSGPSCSSVVDPPAIYAESFTVGALSTGTDSIASFSSRGPVTVDGSNRQKPDIAAPGTSTRSSTKLAVNSYGSLSGTSMATPHVAGAVALMLSAQPNLRGNVPAIEGILRDSAVHINSALCSSSGTWPNNVFGYGRLDAKAATDMALTTFSPLSGAFGSAGTDESLSVLAPTGVNWTATSNDSWITIIDGSGTGNGTVSFVVRDNPNEQARIGKITIAHRDFIVRQEGYGQSECSFAATPKFQSFPAAGGPGSTTVATSAGCVWTATSNIGWVKITSDNGGLGPGALTFTVDPNGSGSSRKGTINISGAMFSIKQR
jgi:subtilisin family serine protease